MTTSTRIPPSEHVAIRNWAEQSDPSVWKAVPGARPFMIATASMARAECEFYGAFADVWPEYRRMARGVMVECAPGERVPLMFEPEVE